MFFGNINDLLPSTFRHPFKHHSSRAQQKGLKLILGKAWKTTFYAITDFLLGGTLGVCFWICVAYGFAAIAMLVPSISDFDVALGRTTHDAG